MGVKIKKFGSVVENASLAGAGQGELKLVIMRLFNRGPVRNLLALFTCIALMAATYGCDKLGRGGRDKVVIRVGERGITQTQFEDSLKRLLPEGAVELGGNEFRELKKNLINQLIEETLLVATAERMGLDVTEAEIEAETVLISEQYEPEELESIVVSMYGTKQAWYSDIRKKLLIRKAVELINTAAAEITDEQARLYYEKNKAEFEVPEQVHARMILVKTGEEAEAVKKRLKKEDFAKVAAEVSISPEADEGGDLGFFAHGEMPLKFEEIVFSLSVGKISAVLETPYGHHIFKVEEKRKGKVLDLEEATDVIKEKLMGEEEKKHFLRWLTALKMNTDIEIDEALL